MSKGNINDLKSTDCTVNAIWKSTRCVQAKNSAIFKIWDVQQIVIFVILLDLSAIRSRYVRSLRPMLGDWERYFSCRPFCLTQRRRWHSEVCLSAVCVIWRRNNNRKLWPGILHLFPRIDPFIFLGYLNQLEYVFIRSYFKSPLERKTLCTPLPFGNLSLLDLPPPLRLGNFVTLRGRGGFGCFLEPHNKACH